MITRTVSIPAEGAHLHAYLAAPEGAGPWPALIVIHEIWGLVPHIEDVARRFAGAGYAALAPDLYSRGAMPVPPDAIGRAMGFMQTIPIEERRDPAAVARRVGALPDGDREVIERALDWLQNRDLGQNVRDLVAVRDWLAAQPFVDAGRVSSLGFCMGGALSARLASSGADLAGCVTFYGENPRWARWRTSVAPSSGCTGAPTTESRTPSPSWPTRWRPPGSRSTPVSTTARRTRSSTTRARRPTAPMPRVTRGSAPSLS
jgi:carboxymethylenebutenolidase